MHMTAPGQALIGWQQPDIRDRATSNTWEQVEEAIEKERPGLQLLQQIVERPNLDFHLDYKQGAFLLLPHLSRLKQSAQKLSISSLCELRRSDTDSATKEIRAILALVKGMEHEPLPISQLVRIAIVHIAFAAQWELLQSKNVTDGQLTALGRDWDQLEFLRSGEAALAMERAMVEGMLSQMRRSSAEFRRYSGGWGGTAWVGPGPGANSLEKLAGLTVVKAREMQWRTAWSYPDQMRTLQGEQALVESFRLAREKGSFIEALHLNDRKMRELGIELFSEKYDGGSGVFNDDLRTLFSQSILSLQRLLYRELNAEVARSLAITGLALKRYQLKNGAYPSALAQLVPDFLPGVPRDPVDGQPLRYRLAADGAFVLYSIGEDGKDDGGDPTSASEAKSKSIPWQKGRDLVWPQPAHQSLER
jgi:hypothetical protein